MFPIASIARRRVALAALVTVAGAAACAHREPIPIPVPVQTAVVEGEAARRVAEQVEGLASMGYSGALLIGTASEPALQIAFGWADRDPRRPQAVETVHYWASVAKPFTAAATFRLIESGALSLDDTVGRHLPSAPPDKTGITVRQLLAHQGGLATYHDLDGRRLDREEAIGRIFGTPLEVPPGGEPAYSNSGYTLLAMVLQAAAGVPFPELVRREVLQPVGATASGWTGDGRPDPMAHGYLDGEDRGPTGEPVSWALYGAGGMTGPAVDLYRFGRALLDGSLLSAASWGAMTEPATGGDDPVSGHDNALGWKTWMDDAGRRVVEKGGSSDSGFQSLLRLIPEDGLVVVALLNTRDVPYPLGKDVFVNRMLRAWRGEPQAAPPAPAPEIGIDAFEGVWSGEAGRLRIQRDDLVGTDVSATGQALVDVLLDHDADERAAARAANERSERVLEGIVGRDGKEALELASPTAGPGLRAELERLAAAGWVKAEILGTSREFFRDAAGLMTYVRLTGTDGELRDTRLHWDPRGRIRGIGGSAFPAPVLAVLIPVGEDRAVVHHPGLGTSATMVRSEGRIVLESPAGRVVLSRR